ncbi:MAG: hypothetical protein ACTSW1_16660 [Candidatus Hodarchaeales archaeon]
MAGLKISSDSLHEVTKILGIDDDAQGKVYISLLSLGNATLGQISLVTGLDYLKTQDALQVLVGSKLVRRIPGVVGRYIALEPFLKSFILAYDPITLVNIRKESVNILKNNLEIIESKYNKTSDIFKKSALDLENDFLESLNPVTENFSELTLNIRKLVDYTRDYTNEKIEKISANIDETTHFYEELTRELKKFNAQKIDQIPSKYHKFSESIETSLSEIDRNKMKSISSFKSNLISEFEAMKRDVSEYVTERSRVLTDILNEYQDEQTRKLNELKEEYDILKSQIKELRQNSFEKRRIFEEIKTGYEEVSSAITNMIPDIKESLAVMDKIIAETIEDIRSRKLFKGKDDFLEKLNVLKTKKTEIEAVMNKRSVITNKSSELGSKLEDAELNVVNASEKGFEGLNEILKKGIEIFGNSIDELKIFSTSEFHDSIRRFFEQEERSLRKEIENTSTQLSHKIEEFNNRTSSLSSEFQTKLNDLINEFAEEYKQELISFIKDETGENYSDRKFITIKEELGLFKEKIESESNLAQRQIENLDEAFKSYITGLNAFTSSFANTLHDAFVSTLNTGKDILNDQTKESEAHLEREIAALVFTIKQMKQNLSKIFELSRTLEITETEASLINSDIVIGESSIIMLLRDLTLRSKSSLTILMPRPELQTLIAASKLPMRTRVTIIGDFKKVPTSTLKKILASNNVRLKQLDGIEFWGCIKDAEELLVCPEPKDPTREELIGVITTNENLVELFSQELMTYTTRSREILPQDLN